MAKNVVNLDSVVGQLIAKPVTKDGCVLYARVDNKIEGLDGSIVENYKQDNSARQKYNSPDNLRRLFITLDGVYVQYHKPIHGGNGTLFREYSWGDSLGDIERRKAFIKELGVQGCNAQRLEMMSTSMGLENFPALKGFGLGALNKPWVYQNVEEVYVDELVFTCYNKYKQGDFSTYYNGTSVGLLKYLLRITIESVGVSSLEELRNKFPRLHTIGYIHNLNEVIKQNKVHLNGNDEKKEERVLSFADKVFGVSEDKLLSSVLTNEFAICRLYKNRSWMLNYSKKTGLYKFDSELESYFEDLKNQYKKAQETNTGKSEMTEIDKALINAFEIGGEQLVRNVLQVYYITGNLKKEQLRENMSSEVYERFKHLI